jgi:hypothetical protein
MNYSSPACHALVYADHIRGLGDIVGPDHRSPFLEEHDCHGETSGKTIDRLSVDEIADKAFAGNCCKERAAKG